MRKKFLGLLHDISLLWVDAASVAQRCCRQQRKRLNSRKRPVKGR
uniref:Uncharacterized protein n=1 Tax=Rheinheimera sp. BAL341 TaxID=1708203 RepID=A0A486XUH4_9GAMM